MQIRNNILYVMVFSVCFMCSCNTTKIKPPSPFDFPKLVDEVDKTDGGALIKEKYKGKVMYHFEKMLSEDKSICVSSLYCGLGAGPYMVKFRIYGKREMVDLGNQDFKEEYVPFREEYIKISDPMILMLETIDQNGELVQRGYISQWESSEFYEKFIKENKIIIRWTPEKIITTKKDIYQKFQAK